MPPERARSRPPTSVLEPFARYETAARPSSGEVSFRRSSGRSAKLERVRSRTPILLAGTLLALTAVTGCGGSAGNNASHAGATTATSASPQTSTAPATTSSPGLAATPLTAEANSAAAGDIPDNQVFLTFRNTVAGYSMKYPEGWAQQGSGRRVTFRDKNNIVRIVVGNGALPSHAWISRQLALLPGAQIRGKPQTMDAGPNSVVKVVYATESAPSSVTGKRVTLVVDRYYLAEGGKQAVIDLATPRGVDNVDAYRLMIESFQWR